MVPAYRRVDVLYNRSATDTWIVKYRGAEVLRYSDLAVERWSTAHDPRLAEVMSALVRHLHEFAREVRLTEGEWIAGLEWLTRVGQISDEKRVEAILASDVLGLSMLVVQMNNRF